MFKLIGHAVFFALGAASGVYWGVHHPAQAADLSNTETAKIQQAVAAAKAQVLQQVVTEQKQGTSGASDAAQPGTDSASHLNKYQQMLQSAQAEFNAATVKTNAP